MSFKTCTAAAAVAEVAGVDEENAYIGAELGPEDGVPCSYPACNNNTM